MPFDHIALNDSGVTGSQRGANAPLLFHQVHVFPDLVIDAELRRCDVRSPLRTTTAARRSIDPQLRAKRSLGIGHQAIPFDIAMGMSGFQGPTQREKADAPTKLRRATEGTQAWNRDVFIDLLIDLLIELISANR